MEVLRFPDRKEWDKITSRPDNDNSGVFDSVQSILDEVKAGGDNAVLKFGKKFDRADLDQLLVTENEIETASKLVDEELKDAIRLAAKNIETFHKTQVFEGQTVETTPGVNCWQKSVAIEKVGLYIPGGTAPLFSTVLMLAIPAKIAGCKEIILCTPPSKDGSIHPAILWTAHFVGVTSVFKAGGVQAIGAMAYGTESIPKVFKIFGPGNQFVTAAKQLVSLKDVAIDMPAGPSEVEVIADKDSNPAFIVSDLLSQAEHGETSQVILVTDTEDLIAPVLYELDSQLSKLPRKDMARKAIANSRMIVVKNTEEIVDISNLYAPEHLIIQSKNYNEIAEKVVNAGSVFLGQYTPESAGDYASGTNHTLPTNGYARAYSGVNLDSFTKKITFQEITAQGLTNIGPAIEKMAEAEQLMAHKNAVSLRLKDIEDSEK
ncbi:histidinol dehydrogenase [Saccharicrinis sp. FJH54]|uniref:histidinol dehydrogenase n=1 Tax=Saccharicrinis sp. FJH54 TaxID=3344665 RepID=UPI0035D48B25